jgi:PAS domain S-box-containing protein
MRNTLVKCATFGLLSPILAMLLIGQLSAPAYAQSQPQVLPAPTPKRVLLLYTYGDGLPGYQKATPAFLSVTTAGGIDINDLFFEYLDLQRNNNTEYRQKLADLLRYKYSKHQVGLVVTVHTAALNFLLDEGKELFPDAPVFSYLITRPELIEAKKPGRRILQRPQNLDVRGTLEIALKMFPQTRKIVFVTGAAEGDRRLEHEAKGAFEPWRDKLEFQYTSDRSVEEMVQLVASLPPRSIVIYNNVFSDKTGRTFIPREVGKMVAKAANAPVFCLWDTLIGCGVIGGSLLSFEAEGTYAANVVLDILNGKILLTKPVTTLLTSKIYMFDWQQLKRWGVNESILPKGSVLVNRVPTMWEQHKGLVIVGIAAFLAQTMLVIGLLVQRNLKKKAESSVRQKTEELDQFFNVTLDLLSIANTGGYFLRLNPVWEKVLGYTREELMAKRFLDFVHPDDLDRTREAVSTLSSQQEVISFENRYRCKDGTYRWLEWSSSPAGKLIYAAVRDVTERKRTEEVLREKEEAARKMAREASVLAEIGRMVSSTLHIDQIYEAFATEAKKIIPFDRIVITIIDSEKSTARNVYMAGGEIQDREVESVYPLEGSGNAEMLRTKAAFLLQTEDFREYKDRFPMLLSTFEAGFRSIMNVPLILKGKVIGGLLLRSRELNAYTDKDVRVAESIGNQIAGAIAIAHLFQEQKQMENRLRESEERFRQVAETVGDFIWEVDADGLYRYTSPSVEKILGYTPGELIGKMHFYDLFVPEVREELKTAALNVFAAKQTFQAFRNPNTSKEGKVVHLETSGVPVLDGTGNLVGYRGADTDVTERKRAEQESFDARREMLRMERLSRMGELTASLAHELNQPLTAILSNAQAGLRFLQSEKPDLNELREILQDISSDDKRAGSVIRSLRAMMKQEEREREPLSINEMVREVVTLFHSEAVLRNVVIDMELTESLPPLLADKIQLQQVVLNLMMNAAEAMDHEAPERRKIFLKTRRTDHGAIQVAIQDCGPGIEQEKLDRVFQPFFTTKGAGLGMGLSFSRSIIEAHGGRLWAENNRDKGATFYFELPVTSNQ